MNKYKYNPPRHIIKNLDNAEAIDCDNGEFLLDFSEEQKEYLLSIINSRPILFVDELHALSLIAYKGLSVEEMRMIYNAYMYGTIDGKNVKLDTINSNKSIIETDDKWYKLIHTKLTFEELKWYLIAQVNGISIANISSNIVSPGIVSTYLFQRAFELKLDKRFAKAINETSEEDINFVRDAIKNKYNKIYDKLNSKIIKHEIKFKDYHIALVAYKYFDFAYYCDVTNQIALIDYNSFNS